MPTLPWTVKVTNASGRDLVEVDVYAALDWDCGAYVEGLKDEDGHPIEGPLADAFKALLEADDRFMERAFEVMREWRAARYADDRAIAGAA